jgi:hypothetical protein
MESEPWRLDIYFRYLFRITDADADMAHYCESLFAVPVSCGVQGDGGIVMALGRDV